MLLAAVSTCLNEADICGISLRHGFAHGIDRWYIRDAFSTDGTRDIFADLVLEGYDLRVSDDTNDFWYQDRVITELTAQAGDEGAEWVLPLDMDEFTYPADGHQTIAQALEACSEQQVCISRWLHRDWDYRHVDQERMPKVAFRYQPGISVANGNHSSSISGGAWDILHMRELSFRSFNHFITKNRSRCRTLNPYDKARGEGIHQTRLEGFSHEQMRAEWEQMQAHQCVLDPIPVRTP